MSKTEFTPKTERTCENPKCNNAKLECVFTRSDGMKYWQCPVCGQGVGEVTEAEWKEIEKGLVSLCDGCQNKTVHLLQLYCEGYRRYFSETFGFKKRRCKHRLVSSEKCAVCGQTFAAGEPHQHVCILGNQNSGETKEGGIRP